MILTYQKTKQLEHEVTCWKAPKSVSKQVPYNDVKLDMTILKILDD